MRERTTTSASSKQRVMKLLTLSLILFVIAATSLAGRVEAGIFGSFTGVTDVSGTPSDYNVCILTTPLAPSYDIFGTTVSPGQVLCLQETRNYVAGDLHCETVQPGLWSMDVTPASVAAGTHFCIDPPACSHYANVNTASNPSGSIQDAILANLPPGTSVVYTFDGVEGPQELIGGASPIPGCTTLGPGYGHSESVAAMNGFLVVPTSAGTNVTTSSLTTFFNPITQEEIPIGVDVTFAEVSVAGTTTVIGKSADNVPLDSEFTISRNDFRTSFLDISTTASITPPITVCIHYPDADQDGFIDNTAVPETELGFLHGEGVPVTLVDRTTTRDLNGNVVCGEVEHLSPFAAAPATSSSACGTAPRSGCRAAAKSQLSIVHNAATPSKDKLGWKWLNGAVTTQSEFGDPSENTETALCVFDGNGLVLESVVPAAVTTGTPAKPAWVADKTAGYKFKDKPGTNGGLVQIALKGASTAPKSKVQVKGAGTVLPDLPPTPLQGTVTVQLVNNSPQGACFEGTYSGAQLQLNSGTAVKAKAP